MAFSRNSMAAAIAGSLSLAVLTGCNPPAAIQAPSASPSAAPSAAASASPVASPSAPASPSASATPAPAVSAPAASGKTVTVSGKIYDEAGALVDGATVTVKSLSDANAYTATATTVNGNYVFNSIPEGVQVAITATKDKWTSRTRTEAFQASATVRNDVNFGSADKKDAYFISKYPEIVSTTPADEATGVDASKISYKLILSEALDESNRRKFRNSLKLRRNIDVTGNDFTGLTTQAKSELSDGSTFLGESDVKAALTWNAAATEATLTFNAPLLASSTSELEYKVYLDTVEGETIEDSDGNALGLKGESDLGITNYDYAFKKKSLAIGEEGIWKDTHQDSNTFKVAEDDTDPKLTAVAVTSLTNKTRIELTFSEPMAAYNAESTGVYRNSLKSLRNYSFMVGEKIGDLKSSDLDGKELSSSYIFKDAADTDSAAIILPTKLSNSDAKNEFSFRDSAASFSVDPRNANRVFIDIAKDKFFGTDLAEIKARVSGVADPAGNQIGGSDADKNLVTGNI